jgi:hypothetical protein
VVLGHVIVRDPCLLRVHGEVETVRDHLAGGRVTLVEGVEDAELEGHG